MIPKVYYLWGTFSFGAFGFFAHHHATKFPDGGGTGGGWRAHSPRVRDSFGRGEFLQCPYFGELVATGCSVMMENCGHWQVLEYMYWRCMLLHVTWIIVIYCGCKITHTYIYMYVCMYVCMSFYKHIQHILYISVSLYVFTYRYNYIYVIYDIYIYYTYIYNI